MVRRYVSATLLVGGCHRPSASPLRDNVAMSGPARSALSPTTGRDCANAELEGIWKVAPLAEVAETVAPRPACALSKSRLLSGPRPVDAEATGSLGSVRDGPACRMAEGTELARPRTGAAAACPRPGAALAATGAGGATSYVHSPDAGSRSTTSSSRARPAASSFSTSPGSFDVGTKTVESGRPVTDGHTSPSSDSAAETACDRRSNCNAGSESATAQIACPDHAVVDAP